MYLPCQEGDNMLARKREFVWPALLICAFILGFILSDSGFKDTDRYDHSAPQTTEAAIYTCSMHPSVRQQTQGT